MLTEAILDFQRVLKLTNHSDYAEPARFCLNQLGRENPLPVPSPLPGVDGATHVLDTSPLQLWAQDYVL
jgi:hypothetical protein